MCRDPDHAAQIGFSNTVPKLGTSLTGHEANLRVKVVFFRSTLCSANVGNFIFSFVSVDTNITFIGKLHLLNL